MAHDSDMVSLDVKATAGAIRQLLARIEYDASWDKCGPLYYALKQKLEEHDEQSRQVDGKHFEIRSKDRKRFGKVYPGEFTGMFATVTKDTIHLTGRYSDREIDIKFSVGDTAEYDSYNLSYLGKITKITDKRITIEPHLGSRTRSLDLYTFAWRNHNFDLEKIERQNLETSYSI